MVMQVGVASIKGMPFEARVQLLKYLGYDSDEDGYVIDPSRARVVDKYVDVEVRVDNMIIAPGSTIILDDNPLSIAGYLDEFEVVLRGV